MVSLHQQHGWPPGTFLGGLSPNAFHALIARGRQRRFEPGETLLFEGDLSEHVLVLMSGAAKVTAAASNGRDVLLRLARPGTAIGVTSMVDHGPRPATVTSLGTSTTLVVSGPSFAEYLAHHPEALRALMAELTNKLRNSDSSRRDLSFGSLPTRMARLLTTLATDFGIPTEAGSVTIALSLSQQELASLIGASRESVARALRQLRDAGIISTRYRHIVIHDIAHLRRLLYDKQ